MSIQRLRAVYDYNVVLQAVLSASGPAFRCLQLVEHDQVEILSSADTLSEIRDVLGRPKILAKNPQVTPERVAQFLDLLARKATLVENVERVIQFPQDPKDEPYLNLAVAGNAARLVTRDAKHLLKFFSDPTPEAGAFRAQYAQLRIVDPVTFLSEFEQREAGTPESG